MSESRFDVLIPRRFGPMSRRDWVVVIVVAVTSLLAWAVVYLSTPSLASGGLFLLAFAGTLFTILALYREFLIRWVNALRGMRLNESVRVLLFGLGVSIGPLAIVVVALAAGTAR